LYCKKKTCDLEPNACNQDGDDEWGNPMKKRDLLSIPTFGAHRHGHGPDHHHGDYSFLEKRGPKRPFAWKTAAGLFITQYSLTYPTPGGYMRNLQNGLQGIARRWWRMRSENCENPDVAAEDLTGGTSAPTGAQVEHTLPVRSLFPNQPSLPSLQVKQKKKKEE
jgi:hypothetical protein